MFGDTTQAVTVPGYTPAGNYTVTISQAQTDLSGGANATPAGYTILSSTKSIVNTGGAGLTFNTTGPTKGAVQITASEPSMCFINTMHSYEYSITANIGINVAIATQMAVPVTNGNTLQFSFVPSMEQQPNGTILYISVYVK